MTLKYDVIDNGNGTFSVDVAVPGFTREDLSLYLESLESILIKSITLPPSGVKYIHSEIESTIDQSITINPHMRVETAHCENGILRILLVPREEEKATIKIC